MSAQEYYNPSGQGQQQYPSQSQYTSPYNQSPQPPYPFSPPGANASSFNQQPGYSTSQQNLSQSGYPQDRGSSGPLDYPSEGAERRRPSNAYPEERDRSSRRDSRARDGGDNEKGFLATVGGGASGALIGDKVGGGGTVSKLVGGAAGAIVANVIEKKIKGGSQAGGGGFLSGLMGDKQQPQQGRYDEYSGSGRHGHHGRHEHNHHHHRR